MFRRVKLITMILLLFLLTLGALPAADAGETTLDQIMSATGARLQWDPMREVGALWRGNTRISFRPGGYSALVNGSEQIAVRVSRGDDGGLSFDDDGAQRIIARLRPEVAPEQRRVAAIFIDPGHGGRDPGTIGRHRIDGEMFEIQEKHIVLDVSHRLARLLESAFPDRQIVMSRSDDRFLTLEQRTALANAIPLEHNETVLFVSIHANASLNSRARGVEVWYLTPEFRRRDLIDPARVGVSDPGVLTILNTMREEEFTIESVLLARNILAGLYSEVGAHSPNRGIKQEAWYVVREARMPSVLVELGFVTNQEEALNLADDAYLQRLAHGIYNGILNFVAGFEN